MLEGIQIFDETRNRFRQFVFLDSVHNFVDKKSGRPKGSLDKASDRRRRKKAARRNGRLGGLAGRGIPKKRTLTKLSPMN
jgi:hypothetical protein